MGEQEQFPDVCMAPESSYSGPEVFALLEQARRVVRASTLREQTAPVPDDVREALAEWLFENKHNIPEHMFYPRWADEKVASPYTIEKCLKLADKIQPLIEAAVKEHKNALEFARGAIGDAIYLEDGLDGGAGQIVINMITEVLDDKDEYESTFKDGE